VALRAMALNRRQPDRALVMLRVRLASCSLQAPPQGAIALGPSVNAAASASSALLTSPTPRVH
jgi:hypothetical protein